VRTTRGASWRAFVLCVGLLGLALLGGSETSRADSTSGCNAPDPTGRHFCVTIEDKDGVSPSGLVGTGKRQVNVTAYQYYKFSIANQGGSTLTNGTLKATLTDHVERLTDAGLVVEDVVSTADYIGSGSAPFCKRTAGLTNTVSCTLPNIPAGPTALEFYLVYRTSTTPDVKLTNLSASVAFKEGSNGQNGANPATLQAGATTDLEGNPQDSVAWSPPGASVTLGTSPTFDTQFSVLQYTVPAGKNAFRAETSEGPGSLCSACFGELVTTDLKGGTDQGAFTNENLFHLTITLDLGVVSGGNVNNVFVAHLGDGDTVPEIIRTRCSSATPPKTDTFPCIKVTKDNQAKLLIIDVWGYKNGGWQSGLS
jgi:hypothetical protein